MGKTYSINISKKALKSLVGIHPQIRERVMQALDLLAINPFPAQAKKVLGSNFFRVRIGQYRIIYEVNNQKLLIYVISIDHRKDVYQKL